MTCLFTPSRTHINLGALRRNFKILGEPEHLMPVIKSDAYGHGLAPCAQALSDAGARNFAVGLTGEGVELRNLGLEQTIVPLLGCLSPDDWQMAFKYRLTPLIGSFDDLSRAIMSAREFPGKLPVGIKCNTGMSRLGFDGADLPRLREELNRHPSLVPSMLISHLSCADMPEEREFTQAQIKAFNSFYEGLRDLYPDIRRSLGNSAATLGVPEACMDIRRPGLALYGGDPFPVHTRTSMGESLEWVMSVSSPITHIRNLQAEESVSYGRMFKAKRPMRIAIVAAGYATGINRNLSNRINFLVNGRKARQLGRICMSMLMIDISHIDGVRPGDEAWLLGSPGSNGEKATDADAMARMLDTIPYEILCLMGCMNPRVYENM